MIDSFSHIPPTFSDRTVLYVIYVGDVTEVDVTVNDARFINLLETANKQ